MEIKYMITAYSPSLTQETREIELDGNIITDAGLAAQRADSFAQRLNSQHNMNVTDWIGITRPI
jgi:hypothetical protein